MGVVDNRNSFCAATSLQRGQANLATLEGGSFTQKIWPAPGAAVTVLCTPDDGCGGHPKHVEWTCRIINRLLCVPFRWTIINTDTGHIPEDLNPQSTVRTKNQVSQKVMLLSVLNTYRISKDPHIVYVIPAPRKLTCFSKMQIQLALR